MEEYVTYDVISHIKQKGMWAGAVTRTAVDGLRGAAWLDAPVPASEPPQVPRKVCSVVPIEREHTPALLKAFDELLVNASDHAAAQAAGRKPARVTYIHVDFRPDGVFAVENDGPGIPVELHPAATAAAGRDVYVPEVAFCIPFSGTNMKKEKANIKGGINGIGAKIANIHSALFEIETVAAAGRALRLYRQRCRDGLAVVEPPEVSAAPGATPHTRVVMHPAYPTLGYAPAGSAWAADHADLLSWLRLRCCQLAAYAGPEVAVRLNGARVPTTDARELARLYLQPALLAAARPLAGGAYATTKAAAARPTYAELAQRAVDLTVLRAKEEPYKKHPWAVALAVVPELRSFAHAAIINGVVTNSGPHVAYIKDELRAAALGALQRASKDKATTLTAAEACKHVLLMVVGALPGAEWTGQRKDELSVSRRDVLGLYKFPAAWLKQTGELLADAHLGAPQRRAPRVKVDKYRAARAAGPRRGGPVASLIVAEGDSALTLFAAGLALKQGGPSYETHGLFSLGGVPINPAKQVSSHTLGEEEVLVRSRKLRENKTLAGLEQVLGLEHGCAYASPAERERLAYREVVVAVDQDVDGAGKILGLLLTYFHLFWPALLADGFVKWFMTPVIRVYPAAATTARLRAKAGPVAEFYHERDFEAWAEARGGTEAAGAAFCVRYYKGLGGHEDFEVPAMFRDFERRLYRLQLDGNAPKLFAVYFGPESAPRKAELSTPLRPVAREALQAIDAARVMPCSFQLQQFAKAYKLDALQRQLPGALDSFTVGRRKAIAGAIVRLGRSNESCKTFQLAGFVADRMQYHHGGKSMEDTITKMCQSFPGARAVPLLQGAGAFGTRAGGGTDAASPRYTSVELNRRLVNALLPPEDSWLLAYEFVDGVRAEPTSYVPVLPLTALDFMEIPSEGWNYLCWGRRPSQVAAMAYALCGGSDDAARALQALAGARGAPLAAQAGPACEAAMAAVRAAFPLDVSLLGVGGRVGMRRDRLHHFGTYRVEEEARGGHWVLISELPLRVWTNAYVEGLTDPGKGGGNLAALIEEVADYSDAKTVDVRVRLQPGALDKLRSEYATAADPLAEAFRLYTPLRSNLNVIRPQGGVIELGDDYHKLVVIGLSFRLKLYAKRVERQIVMLELQIAVEEQTLRYIALTGSEAGEQRITAADTADEASACRVLAARGFPRVNLGLLKSPRYAKAEFLRDAVVKFGAADADSAAADADSAAADSAAADADSAAAADAAAESAVGASYGYLLNLRERDKLESACAKRAERLAGLRAALAAKRALMEEQPFPAASLWRAEIDEVVAALQADGCYL